MTAVVILFGAMAVVALRIGLATKGDWSWVCVLLSAWLMAVALATGTK